MGNPIRSTLLALALCLPIGGGALEASAEATVEERLEQLEREQRVLKEELEKKDERIEKLESEIDRAGAAPDGSESAPAQPGSAAEPSPGAIPESEPVPASEPATATMPEAASAPAGESPEGTPSETDGGATSPEAEKPPEQPTDWGVYDPGKGFLLGRHKYGEASISAYLVLRYINQMDSNRSFRDHLGQEREVKTRENIQAHRTLVWLSGWLGTEKFRYAITWWTVQDTAQNAIFGNLGYLFHKRFRLYAGINGNPGSRSLQGSHPYWLAPDRVMADEFFRPFFTQGVWANGELVPGFWYSVMAGNNNSTLGTTAESLDRDFTYGGSLWWMPTTHEFGPRGAYGDWEMHDEVATRFGVSSTYSPELRQSDSGSGPNNTSLRLADSVNVFETGALAPGVTVTNVDYNNLSVDAGMKYKGIFVQAEYYVRWLRHFQADGPLPDSQIRDHGFYVQAAFFPIPKRLELYAVTSQIFGDGDAGFGDSSEYIAGFNVYPFHSRDYRINFQYLNVNGSPVSSDFGYYRGGQDGSTVSVAVTAFY